MKFVGLEISCPSSESPYGYNKNIPNTNCDESLHRSEITIEGRGDNFSFRPVHALPELLLHTFMFYPFDLAWSRVYMTL
jgi:hypothetical protein